MATSTFNANMTRNIDLVSWPSAKWRSDYAGHVSYWNDSSSENNQGVFFAWFDLAAIQTALSGQRVTKVRVKVARQQGTGNSGTLAIPVYMQTLNRTTYGVNRTTTLPNSQAVDPQNAQPYFGYSGGALGTVSLTYYAGADDYQWSTDITGATAENIGNGLKDGTYTGVTLYWPYQDNAHYCKLRGYDQTYLPVLELTYEPINTAPYWPNGSSVTVTPNGTIPENTTSLAVSWSAAADEQGNTLYYDVYRSVNGNTTKIATAQTATSLNDNIGTGNPGAIYQYTVYVSDGTLYAATQIQSATVTKNALTAAVLASADSIAFATASIALTFAGAANTNGNTTFTYALTASGITVYNGTGLTSPVTLTIWRSGGYPAGPYIKFDDIKTLLAGSNYNGTLTLTLTTTNAYGTTATSTKGIATDIRTTPTGLANVAYSGGYTINTVLRYLPDQRAVTLNWTAATDPLLGTGITYNVLYKLTSAQTWTTARTGLTTTTTTITPPSADTQQSYNVKVVAVTSYGTTAEASGATLAIDKYLRPLLQLMSRVRGATTMQVTLLVTKRASFATALTVFTYTKVGGGTVGLTLSNLNPTYTYSEAGVLVATTSYTMVGTIQDDAGTVIGSSVVTVDIPVPAYTPMLSVRKKGVGINTINDGTGNYMVTLTGKINSVADANGYKGFFKDGVEIGDFSGPASSVADNFVSFNGAGGKTGKDSGLSPSKVAQNFDASSSDLDTLVTSGMYRLGAANANMPTGCAYGQLLVIHGSGDSVTQICSDYQSTYLYFRSGNSWQAGGPGSWHEWRKLWHDGNDSALLAKIYPVGAIYMSVVSTSPATLFGGTWAAFGAGKVLVSYAAADPDFGTVEGTGGAKTVASSAQTFAGSSMATHQHNAVSAGTPAGTIGNTGAGAQTSQVASGTTTVVSATAHTHTGGTFTGTAMGTHQHNALSAGTPAGTNTPGAATSVLQPFIVVYMWKRTA